MHTQSRSNVNVRVARIFNTYGPRMHINDGRVVSNFISRTLQKKTLQIYGSGKQTRSFQFITDLVDGLVRLMESNVTSPVNLGNPEEYSVEELRSVIADLMHRQLEGGCLPATGGGRPAAAEA